MAWGTRRFGVARETNHRARLAGFLREFVETVVGRPLLQDSIISGKHEQTYRRLRGVLQSRACRDLFQVLYDIPERDLPRISAPCAGDCATEGDCCDTFAYCPCRLGNATASGLTPARVRRRVR